LNLLHLELWIYGLFSAVSFLYKAHSCSKSDNFTLVLHIAPYYERFRCFSNRWW